MRAVRVIADTIMWRWFEGRGSRGCSTEERLWGKGLKPALCLVVLWFVRCMVKQDTWVRCFCLLLPGQMTVLSTMQTDRKPGGGRPSAAVAVTAAWQMQTASHTRALGCWATATRADSTLSYGDKSLFTTGRDTFTKQSEIHFSHF